MLAKVNFKSVNYSFRSSVLLEFVHFNTASQLLFQVGEQENLVAMPSFYSGNFTKDMCRALLQVGVYTYRDEERRRIKIEGDVSISKFLNRLLGMEMAVQQALFQYFRFTSCHYCIYY